MSKAVEDIKNEKTDRAGNSKEARAFDLHKEAHKSVEDSLAVLKLGAERLADISLSSWSAANEESISYVTMMMDTARCNLASAVSLATDLANIKKPADVVAITNAHAKRQMELIMAQNRHLWASAQKLSNAISLTAESAH